MQDRATSKRINYKAKISLVASMCGFIAFSIWTVLVKCVDVAPIGPNNSQVGLSTINGYFHNVLGVNLTLYHITDWLSLIPIGVSVGFAIVGLCQLIKRKSLLKVDFHLLVV